MIKIINKKILFVLVFVLVFIFDLKVLAATNFQDQLSNTIIGNTSKHTISYGISSVNIINDGSVKISFDGGFDLSALTSSDILVTGGDVAWGGKLINPGLGTIVIQFNGNLNSSDGEINVEIGNTNFILNPVVTGTYQIHFATFSSNDGTGIEVESGQTAVHIDEGVQVSATVAQVLVFNISGVNSGQAVNGAVTNATSTSSLIDFGSMLGAGNKIAAHDLSVLTNASFGYSVTLSDNHRLESGVNFVTDFIGTNVSPIAWIGPSGGNNGYFGYTTDDQNLGGIPINRFIGNKWAGLSTTGYEVMYHDSPADGVTVNEGKSRIGYHLEITDFQESGTYDTTITYLCVPSF